MKVTSDGKNYYAIEDIIERYGKSMLIDGVENKLYTFEVTETRETLKQKGFNGAGMLGALKALRSGRPIEHVYKHSGRIKKEYHGVTFRVLVKNMDIEQSYHNICFTYIAHEYFLKAYKKHVRRKFHDIDIDDDPITCEQIERPVYIKNDWNMGSKIVYDLKTVIEFARYQDEPQFFVIHPESNEEIIYCKKVFLGYYSPYTNTKFEVTDIKPVPCHYL